MGAESVSLQSESTTRRAHNQLHPEHDDGADLATQITPAQPLAAQRDASPYLFLSRSLSLSLFSR